MKKLSEGIGIPVNSRLFYTQYYSYLPLSPKGERNNEEMRVPL